MTLKSQYPAIESVARMKSLLYKKGEVILNNKIKLFVPTVGQVLDDEESYYNMASLITAMPIDVMVMLDDAGIDFTSINEYELFIILFPQIAQMNTELFFADMDLSKFTMTISEQNGMPILYDAEDDIVIDRCVYEQITDFVRRINNFKKDIRKPGNEDGKKYMLEKARKKIKRLNRIGFSSSLEPLIVSMVNTEQFKYDFERTRELSIYQFNESVRQVIKKIDYDNRMHGVYAGTVNVKDLSHDDLNWLMHK